MIRKNYLLMFVLTLLVFAGQVSAQSISLKHIPSGGGTEGTVSGQGTEIVVEVSQTGITQSVNAIQITFDFDLSLVTLAAPAPWLLSGGDTVSLLSITAAPVPASASFTFTTKVDVTGREFSISIKQIVLDAVTITPSAVVSFNSVRPPSPLPLDPQLHLDTQIESPAQNNSVLIFTDKRPGDTLQIQLFVPDAAGQDIQAFTLELVLQGKTFASFISSISGSDWMGGSLFSGLSVSDNPTLSGLFLTAATVPMTGYLGQIDLMVTGVLSDKDKLRVTSAFLAVADEGLQSLDVSNAELSFAPICLGDFDDNGIVNMADFMLFGEVFGTRSLDAAYNALMDMDSSGGIDVADFLLFANEFGTTCEQQPPPPTVHIPDANLRAVIEDSLGKASGVPITKAEMASLTRLEAPNSEISDLTGLEHATGLTILNLGREYVIGEGYFNSNEISDLSPLSGLTDLTELDLGDNRISDVSALSGLTNLTKLEMDSNRISDVSALSGLTNLTELGLGYNRISDVSALSGLTNLTKLYLSGNHRISDISPLVANTGLGSGDSVYVRYNPLSATSLNEHIPALQARGVTVEFDEPLSISSGVKLTQNASPDLHPAYSPDGSKIVFVSTRDHSSSAYANREIYVMDANGSNPVRLTHNSVQVYAPVWSSDGSKIAFTSNTRSGGGGEIYVMNADGSNPRNLTQNGNDYFDAYPAWSLDGTKIAFYSGPDHVRDRTNGIYVMNADGSNLARLTSTGQVYALTYSSDGSKIAFVTASNIYVMDADGSNRIQLTESNDISSFGIDWSPDGGKLVFVSGRDGDDDIYEGTLVTSP